jgi:hypothetical protein
MFRDPLSMTSAPGPTAMAAPTFTLPRTAIHRKRCVTTPVEQDATARLAAAIRAATVDRA